MKYKKALLLILDGFGINTSDYGNAIAAAHKPNYDKYINENQHNQLLACGRPVGLPDGIMGNSEVGHMNIGAGRTVWQLNTFIDNEIEQGTFFANKALNDAVEHCLKNDSSLHLFGLLSDGNVHSNNVHLWAILELAARKGIKNVFLHAFMDGRDTLPHSGKEFLAEAEEKMQKIGTGKIASVSGRYYAMDRDNRWQRVSKAYNAIVNGDGEKFGSAAEAIEASYAKDITDEFVLPCLITENGEPVATVEDNDSIIFFNFRADRARELTRCFIMHDFAHFPVKKFQNLKYVTFSEYDIEFSGLVEVAFPPHKLKKILGEVVSDLGLQQLRLAETEKYAHVTFFFNGGVEKPFAGEERIMVPSPKVATYDLQPEMSAFGVKDKLVEALTSGKYSLIITNFANPDMVGHTGVFPAAVKAVETVDKCLGEVIPAAIANDYNVILIADHGNADEMLDKDGNILTQHSTNPVPVIISLRDIENYQVKSGKLADVAPTILKIMGIPIPQEMTGEVLIYGVH
ncbi:MAG: 2,3-bisphosphoglycerate-independent phosphoglycerate mutase [Candidatus Cloacimonetes bacterium]|nr:2,3-bisphosphoglycerate-independent phosphoglycerate mutase [Candidatus Cloacimonadota bacterium]